MFCVNVGWLRHSAAVLLASTPLVFAAVTYTIDKESCARYAVVKSVEDPNADVPGVPGVYPGDDRMKAAAQAKFPDQARAIPSDVKTSVWMRQLFSVTEEREIRLEAVNQWCAERQFWTPYSSTNPPKWAIHTNATFSDPLLVPLLPSFKHFVAAQNGTVINANLLPRLPINNLLLRANLDVLCGDGLAIRYAQGRDLDVDLNSTLLDVRLKLKDVCSAAEICYEGYEPEDIKKRQDGANDLLVVGRFVSEISSPTHPNAALISYKLTLPSRLASEPPPLLENQNALDLDDVEMEVFVMLRGTSSRKVGMSWFQRASACWYDWIGANLRCNLTNPKMTDLLPVDLPLHTGYLARHRRLAPLIYDHIEGVKEKLLHLPIPVNVKTLKFVVTGHSLGGGLGTLLALSLNQRFPQSPISLWTFSSPAIMGVNSPDPLRNTCIRHIRFAVDTDPVVFSNYGHWRTLEYLLPRKHMGDTNITFNGTKLNFHWHKGHSLKTYRPIIQRLADGDVSMII